MTTPAFVHTRVHTEHSISDGLIRVPELVQAVGRKGMQAVAVTDRNNLFSAVKFHTAAVEAGIKPIIGCELSVASEADGAVSDVVFLCMNERGYRNLTRLVTKAYTDGREKGRLYATYDWIEEYNEGLLVLSGGLRGDVGRLLAGGDRRALEHAVSFWSGAFPQRYYIEIYSTGRAGEKAWLAAALQLARKHGLPVVATNDAVFLEREDYEAHEIKVCINQRQMFDDRSRKHLYSREQYLKSAGEMAALFGDIPSALENTVEIAKRCNLRFDLGQVLLPVFPAAQGSDAQTRIRQDTGQSLKRFTEAHPEADAEVYRQRLDYELGIIERMDYAGYFLIVADFIAWARKEGVPVGPGRGSGSGSLAAYLLGITEVDPIHYQLLFERFLNPERISMPDFDVDFCIEGRDRVIRYVMERYGRDKVSQIITFGSFGAKAAIRDVGRVLGQPYGFVDRLAGMIPDRLNVTLDEALKDSKEFREAGETDEAAERIISRARKIEGLVRNPSRHAGGIVISPSPLVDYTALYYEQGDDNGVAQLDMKDIEKVGLVKFDFLGLKTLTIIDKTIAALKESGVNVALEDIDLQDPETYRLLQRAETAAIFQLESDGIRDLMKKLRPDHFDDLVALLALYRPGPLQSGMSDDYVERKHGADVHYLHPSLEPVLKATYGVIVYQEQVMEIARVMAGYTLGGADILRRAMGKKDPAEMAQQREKFVAGAVRGGVRQEVAARIFDLMEHFAGYGFNKSHSVAYALIAYRTAWLKANHPGAFMAAVMSEERDNTDKIVSFIGECQTMGIKVMPPDINRSLARFADTADGILYGMSSIRNVGRYIVEDIVKERKEHGDFSSLSDFCLRMVAKIKKNTVEVLIRAGVFDSVEKDRGIMLRELPRLFLMAEQEVKSRDMGQVRLFDDGLRSKSHAEPLPAPAAGEGISREQRLKMERDSLGVYLTDHPMSAYKSEIASIAAFNLGELRRASSDPEFDAQNADSFWVAGVIMDIRRRYIRQSRASFFSLDDGTGRVDLALFDKDYENCRDMLSHDNIVVVEIYRLSFDASRSGRRWRARKILTLDQARKKFAKSLLVAVDARSGDKRLVPRLKDSLAPFREANGCPVIISLLTQEARTSLVLGSEWTVQPCEALLDSLRHVAGVGEARVGYRVGDITPANPT